METSFQVGNRNEDDRNGSVRPWMEQSANARRLTAAEWVLLEVEVWFHPCGRRAAWNLSAPWVGPSLFGMSAYRTCTLGYSLSMASANEKRSRDVCLSVTGHPVTER
jgi:hypothetical protein